MSDQNNESAANCCGGSDQNSGASCGCGGAPKGKNRIRTLLFVVIILAAAGVGAYSIWGRSPAAACNPGQSCGSSGSCCPSTSK
jgi:hypothetical protein